MTSVYNRPDQLEPYYHREHDLNLVGSNPFLCPVTSPIFSNCSHLSEVIILMACKEKLDINYKLI